MERAQDREWDDVVHVDQPTTWASHWNSQEMSQTVDILDTSHNSNVNVGLSLNG
jgi:hypothetical protein